MSDMTVFGFGPGDEPVRAEPPPPAPAASMLVNVTFRVALRSPAAAAPDSLLSETAQALMTRAVQHEIGPQPGVSLDGPVAVTAQVTRT